MIARSTAGVRTEVDGRVLLIWLDRPEARNAIDGPMAEALEAAVDRLESDDELWCGVLGGRGSAFCAGADLKAVARGEWSRLFTERGGFAGIAQRRRSKPIVACVQGPAVGGGFEVALACDVIVASELATFGLPEVRRSTFPVGGGLMRLVDSVGEKRALRLLLTGDPLPASELAAWGLVAQVAAPAEVSATAVAWAQRIARNAPVAVSACVRAVQAGRDQSEAARWAMCRDLAVEIMGTSDAMEGVSAFLEGRPPVWRGR